MQQLIWKLKSDLPNKNVDLLDGLEKSFYPFVIAFNYFLDCSLYFEIIVG